MPMARWGKPPRLCSTPALARMLSGRKVPTRTSWFPSPDNRYLLVADLGLDEVLVYRFDPVQGTLAPNSPPFAKIAAGSGPRHLAFRPDGRFVYALSELAATVTAFQYDPKGGTLKEVQTLSALPGDFKGANSCAEIAGHPTGQFLYASNRGNDSMSLRHRPGQRHAHVVGFVPPAARLRAILRSTRRANSSSPPTRIRTMSSCSPSTTRPAASSRPGMP